RNLIEAIVADDGSHFGGWSVNVSQWLERASIVIRFEDLIRDPIASAERLRPFLDLGEARREKLPSFEDLRTKDMPYGSGLQHGFSAQEREFRRRRFFRRGAVGAWKDEMPEELHHLFWKRHRTVMERLGYPRGQSLLSRTRGSFAWEWAELKGRLVKQFE
ncbi:MAG: sulfotransferase domain-containing protein, partial [Candidatus Omnitrophota bacterium]